MNKATVSRRGWIRRTGLGALGFAVGTRAGGQVAPRESERLERYPELKHINLAGNENPFGPSQRVSLAVMRELPNSSRYPFREETILKDRIAAREGVTPDHILLGNGCDEILSLTGAVYGNPGAKLVATRPTYLQLMDYAEKRGAEIKWIDHTPSMHHDLGLMLETGRRVGAGLQYVCNPDTPSGTVLPTAQVREFCLNACESGSHVFLDEVYLDLLEDFEARTQVRLVKDGYPVIIGRSFSKMHGLAGHRVGYAIASPEIVETLGSRKMSGMGYLGVAAAIASVDDDAFHRRSRRLIAQGRDRFCDLLERLGLKYTPSVGNFVFHHTGMEIRAFQDTMKERGFLVGRPFPPYEDWCRISIGTVAEMAAYEEAMLEVFG